MGRKQKLRQEKRDIKNNAAAAEAAAEAEVTATSDAIAEETADAIEDTPEDINKVKAIENQFPKSGIYVLTMEMADTHNITGGEQLGLFVQGATEHGCVHSMTSLGTMLVDGGSGRIHLALPWILEGAIRGSYKCAMKLVMCYLHDVDEAIPNRKSDAVKDYWGKLINKYQNGAGMAKTPFKTLKDSVERECVICSKTDTKTSTLQQCRGCSMYCYCSEGCQTIHWKERKHRNECKQLQILNKYHEPYADEIRDAVIRGDNEIPSLEKLRYKLGLTRPVEDYKELYILTHNGKPIDPNDYLVAREDGTVWIGSFPNSPIGT